jgi:hypothetical protein
MMANQENPASGPPPPPGHEHDPAPRHEHHRSTIVAGSHSAGDEEAAGDRLTDENKASADDSPAVSDQPKAQLSNLAAEAADQSKRLASEVAQTAKLAGQAGQQVNRLLTAQTHRAANVLHRLACALRDSAQNREQNDVGGQIATYTDRAAARVESMSTYMRGTDFRTMLRDAGQFARRRPEVLLAGTILTGLVVASLLKASRRGMAEPWTSGTGRGQAALLKGMPAVSAAADSLRRGAEARDLNPETLVEKVTASRLGKYVVIAGSRLWRKS